MGFLDNLTRKVGKSFNDFADFAGDMNDRTYGSGHRAVRIAGQGARNAPVRVVEAINPNDAESHGDRLAQSAAKRYGFTPQFQQQIHNSNPVYSSEATNRGAANSNLRSGGKANGVHFGGYPLHRIAIAPSGKEHQEHRTLMHEGLHDSYQTLKPESKVLFDSLVNQAMNQTKDQLGPATRLPNGNISQRVTTPGLRLWLQYRTKGYTANQGQRFNDVTRLPETIQNEIHSFVPEYYETMKQPMPDGLKNYYANYYTNGGKPVEIQRMNALEQLIGRIMGQ